MNYIKELNAFYDWLETNPLSHSAINLWHALMHLNNKTGWITEFTVAISTLENKTGLKKDAITGARHRLQQVNRIDFRSRSGQQSAVYTIIPFESFKPTQTSNSDISVVLTEANDTTKHAQGTQQLTPQDTSIIKLNETKLNNPSDSLKESSNGNHSRQNVFGVYEREIGSLGNIICEKLIDLELTYSEEWTKRAISVAVFAGEKKMRYIEGTLRKWKLSNHPEPWTLENPQQMQTKQHSNYNRGSQGKGSSGKQHIPIIQDSNTPSKPRSPEYQAWRDALARSLDGAPITYEELEALKEKARIADAESAGETEGVLNR
jgi:hypothetical protein